MPTPGETTTRGLSPRVRGNQRQLARRALRRGSIPACAGEPEWGLICRPVYEVYPRVCGGTSRARIASLRRSGLSPRVRGNLGRVDEGSLAQWSIPACAGEPDHFVSGGNEAGVYPRVCGGTSGGKPGIPRAQGLSPRVRGNRDAVLAGVELAGSIPACAGEPATRKQRLAIATVYPRVCGGTVKVQKDHKDTDGLSPRVRGNRDPGNPVLAGSGSIPACAGEPQHGRPDDRHHGVYPRVCGGTRL